MILASDPHYWTPEPKVTAWLKSKYEGGRILEIGPGHSPLPWATTYVDFVDVPGIHPMDLFKLDISTQPLHWVADKSFDFVYCRHVIEDMFNPFLILSEMNRVAKAGYVETPSPLAEVCRGVDGSDGNVQIPWRGYHHHRFMAWTFGGELSLISKYAIIEHLKFDEARMGTLLRQSSRYWNTRHYWEGELKFRHLQSPLDYDIPTQYGTVIATGIEKAIASADSFFSTIQTSKAA